MIYNFLFLICNLILVFQGQFIRNKNISLAVFIIAVSGILISLSKSHIKKTYKIIISALYIIAVIIHFVFSYIL